MFLSRAVRNRDQSQRTGYAKRCEMVRFAGSAEELAEDLHAESLVEGAIGRAVNVLWLEMTLDLGVHRRLWLSLAGKW